MQLQKFQSQTENSEDKEMKNKWDLDDTRLLFRTLSLSFLWAIPVFAIAQWFSGTRVIILTHILVVSGLLFLSIICILIWGIIGIQRSNNEGNT
jgi:hypothetical protein